VNGKCYIGSSSNLSSRYSDYLKPSYFNRNDLVMPRAFKKYGYENFVFEILEYCDLSILISREQYYLDLLHPEYNVAKVAASNLGIKRSEEFKSKISTALKGNTNSLGRVLSDETKAKISSSKKGSKLEDSTKTLISIKLGTKIHCYKMEANNLIHFKSFVSIREAAKHFNTSTTGILYSLKNETLYKKIYKFSYTLLD
jgi:group I intron endonuclease